MKTITIVTPCFNEEDNIDDIYGQIKTVFQSLDGYQYKHLFIDNASTDKTVEKIKSLIKQDPKVQLIVNNRNFGHIRSPYHGLLQSDANAVILIAADLQEPPELIPELIKQWESGFQVVAGVKNQSKESKLFFLIRRIYYALVSQMSETPLISNYTGFGLYDQSVIKTLRTLSDPYPYLRGLFSELGFSVATVTYVQPRRKRGFSKNNFYTLYDMAMLGFTSHSKVPLRLATFAGFGLGCLSLFTSFLYFLLKLIFWNSFSMGLAPLIIGVFFFSAVQLFFIGVLGEYIGQILMQVKNRPMVIERERLNFEDRADKV